MKDIKSSKYKYIIQICYKPTQRILYFNRFVKFGNEIITYTFAPTISTAKKLTYDQAVLNYLILNKIEIIDAESYQYKIIEI